MSKRKAFLKYTTIGLIVLALAVVVFVLKLLFYNNAPIVSGDIEFGIKYKNELKLDLYRPTTNVYETSPVIFFIHGGAWIGGTKASVNFNRVNGAMNTLREHGYTIISPDYSLAGKERSVFPECILDLYEAIDWTKRNAALYDLDTTNLGLLGESAGAHIAMMICFSDTTLVRDKYNKTKFNYLVDIYGPNDLAGIYQGNALSRIDASLRKVSDVFGSTFNIKEYVFGFDPSKDSVRAYQLLHNFSPINTLTEYGWKKLDRPEDNELSISPVLIIHGTSDQVVPFEQSVALKEKLDELGVSNEIHLLDSVDHNFMNINQQQKDSVQLWVADFVMKCYRK